MYNSLRGRTMAKRRSMHSKMATIISSSFLGAGLDPKEHVIYEKPIQKVQFTCHLDFLFSCIPKMRFEQDQGTTNPKTKTYEQGRRNGPTTMSMLNKFTKVFMPGSCQCFRILTHFMFPAPSSKIEKLQEAIETMHYSTPTSPNSFTKETLTCLPDGCKDE
jgi:hypothetical protein